MRRIALRDEAGNAAITEECGRKAKEGGLVEGPKGAVDHDCASVADEAGGVEFLDQRVRVQSLLRRKHQDRGMQRRAGQAAAIDVSACGQTTQADAQYLQQADDIIDLLRWVGVLGGFGQ